MSDISERLALQPEDICGPSRMDMLRERIEDKAEIDRLRARVAELEAIRRLVLFETSEDADGYMSHHPREALFVLRSAANGTAPPAPAVDVDAISDEALEKAWHIVRWRYDNEETSVIDDMRAALRAIFNAGQAKDGA